MAKEAKCPMAGMVCPRNSDPERGKYCPAWTEYVETNMQTGDERVTKECVFKALPRFMIETVKAANRPAAAVESTRNELARGFDQINANLERIPALLLDRKGDDNG